jgi:hypothetical protein
VQYSRLSRLPEILESDVVTSVGARRLTALGAWLITLVAVVGPAASEPPSMDGARALVSALLRAESPGPRPTGVRPNDLVALPVETSTPAPASPDPVPVTTSVVDREPTDLRLLLAPGERWRLMEFGAAATWRPATAKLTAFGQLPYAARDGLDGAPVYDADAAPDPASLGVKVEADGLAAGAQYRSVGKRLDRLVGAPAALKDREGHEVWVAQRFGLLGLRLSSSELTDNVDRNPALPRTTKDQRAVTAELSLSEWPVLGLTYAAGDSARVRLTPEGRAGAPLRHEFESVTAAAYYYGGPRWDASASSTVSQSRRAVRPEDEIAMLTQDLSLTLRLFDSVTAAPSLSLGLERYTPSDVRSDTGTAGLTLAYAPPTSRWKASTFVGYTSTRTSDGSIEGRNVSLSGAVTCVLKGWLPVRSTLSVEAGYDRYVDALVPENASRAISGFVVLTVAGF